MKLRTFAAAALSTAVAMSMAVPAFAMESNTGSSSSARMERKQVDGACMSSAVDKRDTAIVTAFDAFAASTKTALTTRKDALKAAWALTDTAQRQTALKAAWKTFTTSHKSAREAFRTAKKAAHQQFRTDAKTCKGNTSEEGNVEMSSDISL